MYYPKETLKQIIDQAQSCENGNKELYINNAVRMLDCLFLEGQRDDKFNSELFADMLIIIIELCERNANTEQIMRAIELATPSFG